MRTVLTTGANSGLGLATVLELARRGYRSLGSVRSEDKAEAVHEAAQAAGVQVETILLDVTDADRCAAVMDGLGLYGLVNNAGYGQTVAVEDVTDDEARDMLETLLVAPMRLARLALPAMRAAGEGRIINISSIYGRTTTPFTGWYQAAKHGVEAGSDALRLEVARDGIKVVLIEPGGFRTAIFGEAERDVAKRADSRYAPAYRRTIEAMRAATPFMGDPAVVARLVAQVLSARLPRARYLVGMDAVGIAASDRFTPTAVKDFMTRRALGL